MKETRQYQMCSKTVIDTSDPDITFDDNGVCNYVHYFEENVRPVLEPSPKKKAALEKLLEDIKTSGKGKEYEQSRL